MRITEQVLIVFGAPSDYTLNGLNALRSKSISSKQSVDPAIIVPRSLSAQIKQMSQVARSYRPVLLFQACATMAAQIPAPIKRV
jgi:hypothetical protein